MARVKKEEDYAQKRNEILDAAQRFIYTKGYEQMSVQDIVSALNISKGAFYHYFDSKPDLLNALIERIYTEAIAVILPILHDPALSAVEKLQAYFATITRWKTARRDYLMAILRVWYADENAIVRQKSNSAGLSLVAPHLTQVFEQGNAEGVFDISRPELVGQVVIATMRGLGDTMAEKILNLDRPGVDREAVLNEVLAISTAYNTALERILSAPSGTFNLFDASAMRAWVYLEEDFPPWAEAEKQPDT